MVSQLWIIIDLSDLLTRASISIGQAWATSPNIWTGRHYHDDSPNICNY